MNYERLVVENLPVVDSVVRTIARRHRLSADEQDELAASVRLKLVENEYDVLRRFQGRSQLRTYLITVVQRHFLDDRNARWGKWRPSAQARRLGPVAVLLDQLITRDHLPFEEAAETIKATYHESPSREQLHAMQQQLPARSGRQFLGEHELEQIPAAASGEDNLIDSIESRRLGDRIDRVLKSVLATLDDDDRFILRLRFCEDVKLTRIAELMGVPAKPFYRRIELLMGVLRKELEAQGVSQADAMAVIEQSGTGMVGALRPQTPGKTWERPSVP